MKQRIRGGQTEEMEAFKCMLSCMYNKPFEVRSTGTLQALSRQADFYGAKPIVSTALDGPQGLLTRSFKLIEEMKYYPLELLKIGYDLRIKILYKEAMVHIAGRWKVMKEEDGKLAGYPPASSSCIHRIRQPVR